MRLQYHILNGDALKSQFPNKIEGTIIVARECLVDGTVKGNNLEELFASRSQFLSTHYGGTEQEYYHTVVTEFHKILNIPNNTDINLWFEDDLFCQVNFWFIVSLIKKHKSTNHQVFLVRPKIHTRYGFGGLNEEELMAIYKNKLLLTELNTIAGLWKSYQNGDTQKLMDIALSLAKEYPFIKTAVKAHIDRIPTCGNLGKPTVSLLAIMNELNTQEFGKVFQEFCKREAVYGFGDLQVKRLYNAIISNSEL